MEYLQVLRPSDLRGAEDDWRDRLDACDAHKVKKGLHPIHLVLPHPPHLYLILSRQHFGISVKLKIRVLLHGEDIDETNIKITPNNDEIIHDAAQTLPNL